MLRDQRIDAAVLETARGGILRRGLAVTRADVAVVTNIAADHFGEYGITDLAGLAATKLVVAKVIGSAGRLVLNADDAVLRQAGRALGAVRWRGSASMRTRSREAARASGHESATVIDGRFVLQRGEERIDLLRVDEAPVTLGGSARAQRGERARGLARGVVPRMLHRRDAPGPRCHSAQRNTDNPGRASLFELDGVRVLLDYAHNPHGMQALAAIARALPGRPARAGASDRQATATTSRSAGWRGAHGRSGSIMSW